MWYYHVLLFILETLYVVKTKMFVSEPSLVLSNGLWLWKRDVTLEHLWWKQMWPFKQCRTKDHFTPMTLTSLNQHVVCMWMYDAESSNTANTGPPIESCWCQAGLLPQLAKDPSWCFCSGESTAVWLQLQPAVFDYHRHHHHHHLREPLLNEGFSVQPHWLKGRNVLRWIGNLFEICDSLYGLLLIVLRMHSGANTV